MTIDVVVCTKDRPRDLERCLTSLASQARLPDRVVVIDASESSPRPLTPSGLTLEVVSSHPGLPRQRNVALERVTADLVAFVDDDVELAPGYLQAVIEFFEAHQACVGVSGNITNAAARPLASRLFRAVFSLANDDGRLRPSGDAAYLRHPKRPTQVDVVSGSNMVFRRSRIAGLSFDERLEGYAYMEDVDFSLRAASRGELWTIPSARLVHHFSPTARPSTRAYVEQVFVNAGLLFAVHREWRHLRRGAFVRRLAGRTAAYALLSVYRRSLDPIAGALRGLRRVPASQKAAKHRNG
jgi:GT2 family glycosyltransferase